MLNGLWLLLAWLWPLLLAGPARSRRLWWLPPLGAVPALFLAFALPVDTRVELPWLLLGTHLGLDATGRVFLVFTAMLWLAAGVFATVQRWRALATVTDDRAAARFSAFFLLAMGGNFWLILGLDLVSFYAGFAIMGLASYILVIHDGTRGALRAGKVYLIMALVGEVLLFAALATIAAETGALAPAPRQLAALSDLAIGLALLGLGVKAGIFPLHLWLPLAHPAAPVAASAVLSGAMIKVALLGWLRFLPVGVLALPHWGAGLIWLGLSTLFFGLVLGLMQRELKVILAYSSISKMGFLLVLLGLVLLQPALAPVGVAAIALYAAHHGLVKGGLFLGVGLRRHAEAMRQPLVLGGLGFLALAMAGAPLTTGAVAKDATKPLLVGLPPSWLWLGLALTLSTMVATALMARLLWIAKGARGQTLAGEGAAEIAWALLIQVIIILPFALAEPQALVANGLAFMLGLGLVAAVVWWGARGHWPLAGWVGRVPPGDLLHGLAPVYRVAQVLWLLLWVFWRTWMGRGAVWVSRAAWRSLARPPGDPERALRGWPVAGALWLALGGGLLVALLAGQPAGPGFGSLPAGASPSPVEVDEPAARPLALRPLAEQTPAFIPADPWIDQKGASREGIAQEGTGQEAATSEAPLASSSGAAPSLSAAALPGSRGEALSADAEERHDAEPTIAASARARGDEGKGPESREADTAADGDRPGVVAGDLPAPCQSDAPFIFAQADDASVFVELIACVADAEGGLKPLVKPRMSNDLVLLLQRNLQWLGYEVGNPDGMIGPATREAIRAFQQAEGLRSTGGLSFRLLRAIQARIARARDRDEP